MSSVVVFITGASSGIGAAIAEQYAKQGCALVLCARRTERLNEVADNCKKLNSECEILPLQCDVTKKEDLDSAVRETLSKFGRIDVVYANAGYVARGRFEKLKLEDHQRQFDANVFGVLNTIYATLDTLKKTKGRLAILGSVNSYVPMVSTVSYCMSKFAIKALADSLYYDFKPYGISVTLICPGLVESEIRQIDREGMFRPEIKDSAPKWLLMNTEKAARQIVKTVTWRQRERIITMHGKILVFLHKFFPWIVLPLVGKSMSKRFG